MTCFMQEWQRVDPAQVPRADPAESIKADMAVGFLVENWLDSSLEMIDLSMGNGNEAGKKGKEEVRYGEVPGSPPEVLPPCSRDLGAVVSTSPSRALPAWSGGGSPAPTASSL